jgi:hypothetical protein
VPEADWSDYDQNTFIQARDPSILANVVEKDIIKMYVEVGGSPTYDTQIGGSTTVPKFYVNIIQVLGSTTRQRCIRRGVAAACQNCCSAGHVFDLASYPAQYGNDLFGWKVDLIKLLPDAEMTQEEFVRKVFGDYLLRRTDDPVKRRRAPWDADQK